MHVCDVYVSMVCVEYMMRVCICVRCIMCVYGCLCERRGVVCVICGGVMCVCDVRSV